MRKHFEYLKYAIRHKWFVFVACRECGVSLWRSIIHDWSKFLPCEWFAYVNEFYGDWKKVRDSEPDDFRYWNYRGPIEYAFKLAWNHHQKFNKHHWQYWLLTNDSDEPKHDALAMPEKYVLEMVADWWGAGKAITGNWQAVDWYQAHRNNIIIHDSTREMVENILSDSIPKFNKGCYWIGNKPELDFKDSIPEIQSGPKI